MSSIIALSHRRLLLVGLAVSALTLGLAAWAAPPAHADNSSTLTVVGTSDVYDSNLVQAVIKPGFEAAYPGVTLNYVSKGTGDAINYAKAGTASALLVHAAALENQFVDAGYSLEPYGRAIFWGDYVLLGPASDPAGVMSNGAASHDIVTAFEKIAAAGAEGKANFVSRGGTPGTTVQEHAIWALSSGVTTCDMSDANGGGTSPSTTTGDCPSTIDYPSWYHATGLTQGPNIIAGDACNYSGGGCYVFTDRGTFQYLQSQKSVSNLQIVTRDNSTTARGGNTLLVNSFHAYAINPAKFAGNPNVQINSKAATELLNWLTSPKGQTAVGNYLANLPDGAPFIPDAAPAIATSPFPKTIVAGHSFKVTGTVSNVVPGTPALNGVTVSLRSAPTLQPGAAKVVATAKTNASGHFTLRYTPTANRRYWVTTGALTKIENSKLNPVFGDLLAPATTSKSRVVGVAGRVGVRMTAGNGKVTTTVNLKPVVRLQRATVQLLAARVHQPARKLRVIATLTPKPGTTSRTFTTHLASGKWRLQVRYVNHKVIAAGTSRVLIRTIG